ncbi:MAG: hypothetical protein C0424_10885 [Sphingobacteriaceae bacterium]|nr:hypothetical protein [Sphingobacteriaceae bacterium]
MPLQATEGVLYFQNPTNGLPARAIPPFESRITLALGMSRCSTLNPESAKASRDFAALNLEL